MRLDSSFEAAILMDLGSEKRSQLPTSYQVLGKDYDSIMHDLASSYQERVLAPQVGYLNSMVSPTNKVHLKDLFQKNDFPPRDDR